MTKLHESIARQIAAAGPISLAEYMSLCLGHPSEGYYARQETIGARGDFITAPEVSQMFGELIGVWCYAAWQALGWPEKFLLAEAGPGRGALMADLARAASRFPDFAAAADIRLIETSTAMIEHQGQALKDVIMPVSWHTSLEELPPATTHGPLILIANEFLDALPVRQYVKSSGYWRERCVGLDDKGALQFVLGAGVLDPSLLPEDAGDEPDGAVFEYAPAREAWTSILAERLVHSGGMALLIDYGHGESGFGDTFQAVRDHQPADPLERPGEADLTTHVDFAALKAAIESSGAFSAPLVTQGDFLLAMGLLERAGQLGANTGEAERERLRGEAERLAHPDKMGSLFKVLAVSGQSPQEAGFDFPPFHSPS